MNKELIINRYGKHIYAIRLELAMQFWIKGLTQKEAFEMADEFVYYMLSDEHEELDI